MPKLTKEFKKVFEFFRDPQPTSSPASTQFTIKEIEEIQKIFEDPTKDYEEACSEFAKKIKAKEKDLQISLRDDPFVQAIETEYNNQQLKRDMGAKQLFHGLLAEFKRTSPSSNRTQKLVEELTTAINTTPISADISMDLVCLRKMLTLLYQHKIREKLNDKSAEYKLIQALLAAFMLYDNLTTEKFSELIHILLTMKMSNESKIPTDESMIHDLFALRIMMLSAEEKNELVASANQKKRFACRDFFKEISEKNQFKLKIVNLPKHLLSSAQFFEKASYDKNEFAAYQAFIENLANTMAFYRTTPVEGSDAIVWTLLYRGIQRLLEMDHNFVLSDPIPQESNNFLMFLSKIYEKSSLVSKSCFKSAIEILLFNPVHQFIQARNVDEEMSLHGRASEIYKKYVQLNEVESDQEIFLNNLVSISKKFFLSNSTPEQEKEILRALLKGISVHNYPYIKKQVASLADWRGSDKAYEIISGFGEFEKAQGELIQKLIFDLRDTAYAKCSPFLREIAYLHPAVSRLWTMPAWQEMKKIVGPFVEKGNVKEALVALLTFSSINYGLGCSPNKNDLAEYRNEKKKKGEKVDHLDQVDVLYFTNIAENVPKEWRDFTRNCLWLFLLFSDPSDVNDKNLISTISPKIIGVSDPQALFDISKCFANLIITYPETTFNLKEVKSCLADMINGFIRKDENVLNRLYKLAPLFSKNPILFDTLLNMFSEQKEALDFLKDLEPSEINKKMVEYLTQLGIAKLKQDLQPVEKVTSSESPFVNHDGVQKIIIDIREALRQQRVNIPEELLDCYLSACQTRKDDQIFIKFLLTKIKCLKKDDSNDLDKKIVFSYITKALEKFPVVRDDEGEGYAGAISDLITLMNPHNLDEWGKIYKEILLTNLPIAAKRFSNTVECFFLLDLIENAIERGCVFEKDADAEQQIRSVYATIAINYLHQLPTAFEQLMVSEELRENAKKIGLKFSEEVESFRIRLNEQKENIRLEMKERKDEWLQVSSCAKLYTWYEKFKDKEIQIEVFEKNSDQSLEKLSKEIEESINTFAFRLGQNINEIESSRHTRLKEYEELQQKSYQLLKNFQRNSDRGQLLEVNLRVYFEEVDISFSEFKKWIDAFSILCDVKARELMSLSKEDEFDFSQESIKQRVRRQLNNQTLTHQIDILEILHGKKQLDGTYQGGEYGAYCTAIHTLIDKLTLLSDKTKLGLVDHDKQIMEGLVVHLKVLEETDSESSNKQKELLRKIYETLSAYVHEASVSPLTRILYDINLTNNQKVSLLKNIVAKNDAKNYQDGWGHKSVEGKTHFLLATPLYHAVEVGTAEMLSVILGGMHTFVQGQKDTLLSEGMLKEKIYLTPLLRAIQLGDLKKVQLLVEAGCLLNLSHVDESFVMPSLLFAYDLTKGDPKKIEIVDYLIASGADVNVKDDSDNSLLHRATLRGDLKMIDRLVAIPNLEIELYNKEIEPWNKYQNTPLMLAMWDAAVPSEHRYDVIRKLVNTGKIEKTNRLLHNELPKNFGYPASENYLHRAIVDQDFMFAVWLTETTGYNDFINETTLQLASRSGNIDIVKRLWAKVCLLLNTAGRPDVNEDHINALLAALTRKPETDENRVRIIEFILNQLDMKKLEQKDSFQLLMACIHNNTCLMKLIHKGINPNVTDKNKDTLLHLAAVAGDLKTIQLLVKEAKVPSLHPQNAQGLTPLMLAYKDQKLDKDIKNKIVGYFIEETSDLNDLFDKRDTQGHTFFDLVAKANDLALVRQLIGIKRSEERKKIKNQAGGFFGSLATVATSFAPEYDYYTTKTDEQKKNVIINPAYNTAFQWATSVGMVRYFVENSLVDIHTEAQAFIKKLEENNDILPEEKRKIVLFIAGKLLKNTPENNGDTTPEKPETFARKLAPGLFRTRTQRVLPDNFYLLDFTLQIEALKRAIEDQDAEMVATFLDNHAYDKVFHDKKTTIEQIFSVRSQIDFNTKEGKSFWIKVVSMTQDKKLRLGNREGDTLLVALTKQHDLENIEALSKVGYIGYGYYEEDYEKAYAIAYKAMQSARESQVSSTSETTSPSSESNQQAEKTYQAVLGAVKNYLLTFFKESLFDTGELFEIKRVFSKLSFEEINDCHMMIDFLKEAEKIYKNNSSEIVDFSFGHHMTNVLYKYGSIDKNQLIFAKAIFKHHPSLLSGLFRVSPVYPMSSTQTILVESCQKFIGTLFASLRSQNVSAQYKIEDLITSALSCAEDRNVQLGTLLADVYIVDTYTQKMKSKRSQKLVMDESELKGDALAEAKTGNILVHIGHMIEAFGLAYLTQLDGADDQPYLFDYARDEGNRKLYIEIVEICLEKWGIQIPRMMHAPQAVVHIPAPLQTSSAFIPILSTSSFAVPGQESSRESLSPTAN